MQAGTWFATRALRAAGFALALQGMALGGGCQTVRVTSDLPEAHLVMDGEDLGPVGEDGLDVEVGAGFSDVPYALQTPAGDTLEGTLARDDVSWLVAIGALGSSVVLVPALATAAFILTNPVTLTAFTGFGPGAFVVGQSHPSLLTAPAVAAAVGVGLTPLALLLLGQWLPDEVHLQAPGAAQAAGGAR